MTNNRVYAASLCSARFNNDTAMAFCRLYMLG